MKTLISGFWIAFAVSICLAAENAAIGKWDCTARSVTGQQIKATLAVKEEAGKLAGSLWMEGGDEIPLVAPKTDGNAFTFTILINGDPYSFELRIDGQKFSGKYGGKEASGSVEGAKIS